MKKTLTALFILIGLTVCAGIAQAQSSRLYFAGYFGLNTYMDQEFEESTAPRSGDLEYDNAMSFAGALGLRLTNEWRVEAEVSYRGADIDRADFDQGGTASVSGEVSSMLYMLNVYYDFDWEWNKFRPFLSGGIGLASHSSEIENTPAFIPDATDDSFGFAWQVGTGLKYRLTPDLAFTGNYRYLSTTDLEVDSYDLDYDSHEFRLGVEYDIPVNFLQNF